MSSPCLWLFNVAVISLLLLQTSQGTEQGFQTKCEKEKKIKHPSSNHKAGKKTWAGTSG
jgi:hypothetical protein